MVSHLPMSQTQPDIGSLVDTQVFVSRVKHSEEQVLQSPPMHSEGKPAVPPTKSTETANTRMRIFFMVVLLEL